MIGAFINIGISYSIARVTGSEYTIKDLLIDGVSGLLSGALAASGIGIGAQAGLGALIAGGSTYTSIAIDRGNMFFDIEGFAQVLLAASFGALAGAIGGNGLTHSTGRIAQAQNAFKIAKVQHKLLRFASTTVKKAQYAMDTAWIVDSAVTIGRYFAGALTAYSGIGMVNYILCF